MHGKVLKPFHQYRRVVVLTGSGISAESGLKTFRDNDGLWENHRVEDVATPEAFERDPAMVHRFYNMRRAQLLGGVEPNLAHLALAQFERAFDGEFLLVTQNVDNLHERAGSQNVIHMHGELLSAKCAACEKQWACSVDLSVNSVCEQCGTQGQVRPDIVWFGEIPYCMREIKHTLRDSDLFVSIGTSGVVYPAAGFVREAEYAGATCVELNLEHTGNPHFHHSFTGAASTLVPQYFS